MKNNRSKSVKHEDTRGFDPMPQRDGRTENMAEHSWRCSLCLCDASPNAYRCMWMPVLTLHVVQSKLLRYKTIDNTLQYSAVQYNATNIFHNSKYIPLPSMAHDVSPMISGSSLSAIDYTKCKCNSFRHLDKPRLQRYYLIGGMKTHKVQTDRHTHAWEANRLARQKDESYRRNGNSGSQADRH